MRESFGTAFVVNFVVIFIAIFIFFFVAGLSYTKAFKIKNRIVDIVEENECYNEGGCNSINQINTVLQEAGYRVKNGPSECSKIDRLNDLPTGATVYESVNNYRYCVYKVPTSRGGYYYGAVAFMYFDLPLGFGTMEFPVYGETKVMGEY